MSDWQFERSSGFAGYRNLKTGEWLYEQAYADRYSSDVKFIGMNEWPANESRQETIDRLVAFGKSLGCQNAVLIIDTVSSTTRNALCRGLPVGDVGIAHVEVF